MIKAASNLLEHFLPGLFVPRRPVDDALPASPPTGEQGWQESLFARLGGSFDAYNPDLLIRNKGFDVYRKMLRDPQVKAVYRLAVDIMVSRKWRFDKSPENTVRQQQIEDLFRFNIEKFLRGSWLGVMSQILSSKAHGFSINEKVYQPGQFQGKPVWLLRAAKPKPYHTFTFRHDPFGNITDLVQQQGGQRVSLDPSKFIIHITNPEFEPIYGESDLRAAYKPFWAKEVIEKLWNIHLERLAGGFVAAKVNQSLSPGEKDDLKNVMRNLTAETGIIHPASVDFNVHQPTTTDAYEKAVQMKNGEIAKALLAPNLLGLSDQRRVGSFAQARVQLETFFLVMKRQSDQLADTLNEQLFRELAWWNFGMEDFPRFAFEPFTEDQKREIATAWLEAVDKGIVINRFVDELRTRQLIGYESREEGDNEPVTPRQAELPAPDGDGLPPETPAPPVIEGQGPPLISNADAKAEAAKKRKRRKAPGGYQAETAPWRDRIDFADQAAAFRAIDNAFGQEVSALMMAMAGSVEREIAFIARDGEQDFTRAGRRLDSAITSDQKKALNQAIRRHASIAYREGRNFATESLRVAAAEGGEEFEGRIRRSLISSKQRALRFDNHTIWDFEAGWWEGYTPAYTAFAEGVDLDNADNFFRNKAFALTRDLSAELLRLSAPILENGIKSGKSAAEMAAELRPVLEPLLGPLGEAEIGRRIETIVRTNVTDIMVQAQLSVYNDPDLQDFVEALEYSAILDSRVTDFCRRYDNFRAPRDSPIWNSLAPPNHFNCRSGLIAITALDTWTPSNPLPNTIQPQTGFGII